MEWLDVGAIPPHRRGLVYDGHSTGENYHLNTGSKPITTVLFTRVGLGVVGSVGGRLAEWHRGL